MHATESIYLRRDCTALLIPSARPVRLPKGTKVTIEQALGGSFTVYADGVLARITGADADALGLASPEPTPTPAQVSDPSVTDEEQASASTEFRHEALDEPLDEAQIQRQLRTCYDPEIPVNIVDLGLVYGCDISRHPQGGHRVEVRMTLTAPGCGMGAVLAEEVKQKLLQVRGVRSVEVTLVFDPPWDASRISEAAKLQLGLL